MTDKSLYERLGGVFAIAAVVDRFSDAVVKNPIVGQRSRNDELNEWSTKHLDRLAGLKFMRTLWLCEAAGGPFTFVADAVFSLGTRQHASSAVTAVVERIQPPPSSLSAGHLQHVPP